MCFSCDKSQDDITNDNPNNGKVADKNISITPSTLRISKDQKTEAIKLTTSEAWSVSGYEDWCVPSVPSGTTAVSDKEIEIAIKQNEGTVRSATLIFICGSVTKEFLVNQTGVELISSIASESDFEKLRRQISEGKNFEGKTITLTKDISLADNWTPIESFSGILDGANHTITYNTSIRKSNLGLFQTNDGTIGNLKIKGTILGNNSVGSVCSINRGIIRNCSFEGKIDGSSTIGGICGSNGGRIINCQNNGEIVGDASIGGVCGYSYGTSKYDMSTISNCVNKGKISSYGSCAGISASAYYANIDNCENRGVVSGGTAYTGGMVGHSSGYCTILHMKIILLFQAKDGLAEFAGIVLLMPPLYPKYQNVKIQVTSLIALRILLVVLAAFVVTLVTMFVFLNPRTGVI